MWLSIVQHVAELARIRRSSRLASRQSFWTKAVPVGKGRVTTSFAVVTRCSEPAMSRDLAGFSEFSISDAMLNLWLQSDANEPPGIREDALCNQANKKPYIACRAFFWTSLSVCTSVIFIKRSRCDKAVPGRGYLPKVEACSAGWSASGRSGVLLLS